MGIAAARKTMKQLKDYYERDAQRFWDPLRELTGRDSIVYPLLAGRSGVFLEYGCGSGSLLLSIAREPRFARVIGVDISENALDSIRRAWMDAYPASANKVELFRPVDDTIPTITSESCDVIVSVATIEHVIDPYIVLDELYRIAKPDAMLICSVPNYAYIKHRLALLFGRLPKTGTDEPIENWRSAGWDGMHLHTFTQSAFDLLLRDCGWEPLSWTGWGQRLRLIGELRNRFPGLLSGEVIAVCRKA